MRGNFVFRIQPANEFLSPAQKANRVVTAECQPVEGVGVTARAVGRMNRLPIAEAVPVPRTAERLNRAVFRFQPLAELGLSGLACSTARYGKTSAICSTSNKSKQCRIDG